MGRGINEQVKGFEYLFKLVSELKPKEVIVPMGLIVGYTWNRKKKELRFLTLKETEKLTKKGIAWRSLDEEWFDSK